ncbi:Mediator of RNA polymerase II transcription subunit 14 [Golovinomyces cichoracearum]|uniref:Mediator of RNA polymerase II transcription subunit 14 n=1 Tax=Golovinomyces cichoracearum TaxID=62708 RepID=A0A420JAY1_9PEZI|nr:Mediator of RNA polymerase II transcription subunit 14 [Golovinomyces cichoracearum]
MAKEKTPSNAQANNIDIHVSGAADVPSNTIQRSSSKMNPLPPEIGHITQGYVPLHSLIARLAQKTHSELIKTIKDLAQMQLPTHKGNYNSTQVSGVDDGSAENLAKKLRMLKFATDSHEAWTKALVITGWSRKAEDVSKIIDLKVYLDQRQQDYVEAIEQMAHDKRGYIYARLPNPDIKTALEAMVTGKASWMPEFGYIPPPELTACDMLEVLERLNTLLSIRLNLNEYDSVPYHFKNFEIKSGRVSFKVEGEFELDLTIAEEAPDAQYWFLDLRFIFSPCLKVLGQGVRGFLENKINSVLLNEGLKGCYNFIHDIVLTYKINEIRRQSEILAKYRWIHSAKVEALNRSICIQYWIDRFSRATIDSKPPKNWLIIGVHSGNSKNEKGDDKTTRRIGARWFRENKEQKDVHIPIDDVNLSSEAVLTTVVSKHITYILTSIFENLRAKPLYSKQDLSLKLCISESDPSNSELKVQLTTETFLSVRIEPISGLFIFDPPTRRILDYQRRLNTTVIDPAGRAHEFIELLRYSIIYDNLLTYGWTTGWRNVRNPGVNNLEMKRVFKDAAQVHWFKRAGWNQNTYLAVSMNMTGEFWSIVQTAMTSDPTNPNGVMVIPTQIDVPVKSISPIINNNFMITLYVFSVALLSYHGNLMYLWSNRHLYTLVPCIKLGPLNLPFIYIKLSELFASRETHSKPLKSWAKDFVRIRFLSVQSVSQKPAALDCQKKITTTPALGSEYPSNLADKGNEKKKKEEAEEIEERQDQITMVAEIRILKPVPRTLCFVHREFDQNIAFHPATGTFAFRICSPLGVPVISDLTQLIVRVERLVEFVRALEKHKAILKCTKIYLEKLEISYGKSSSSGHNDGDRSSTQYSKQSVYKATIEFNPKDKKKMIFEFEKGNPHLRVVDHLTNLLNSSQGLENVAKAIPLTTQVLQGIEAIERTWESPSMSQYGFVIINARAVDWYIIRYTLTSRQKSTSSFNITKPQVRKFFFEIRLRHRRGEAWWHIIRRSAQSMVSTCSSGEEGKNVQDDLEEVLQPFWNITGKNCHGMRTSVAGKCDKIIELLHKLDEILRIFAASDKIWTYRPPVKAPVAPMSSNPKAATVFATSASRFTSSRHHPVSALQNRSSHPYNTSSVNTLTTKISEGVFQDYNTRAPNVRGSSGHNSNYKNENDQKHSNSNNNSLKRDREIVEID